MNYETCLSTEDDDDDKDDSPTAGAPAPPPRPAFTKTASTRVRLVILDYCKVSIYRYRGETRFIPVFRLVFRGIIPFLGHKRVKRVGRVNILVREMETLLYFFTFVGAEGFDLEQYANFSV